GDILGWTHADLQTDPMDFIRALDIAAAEPKKVYVKGARFGRPLSDLAFTMAMSVSETLLMGTALRDINAQPNVFHRDFYASWADKAPYDFSLDLFVYVMARRAGLAVKRFPVRFGERNFGQSHWNVDWRSKYKFIKRTITYSLDLRQK